MRKYGVENFYVELLETADDTQSLDDLEIAHISKFNSLTPNGYNMTTGGSKFKDDNPMYHEEIRKKVSQHFVGDKNPAKRPEVREKIRQKDLGKTASNKTRKKMSENNGRYWKGKHLSEGTKVKLSQIHKLRNNSGGMNANSKRVQRLDVDTLMVLDEYETIRDAGRWVQENINPKAFWTNISKVCHGHQKTAFGYVWRMVA